MFSLRNPNLVRGELWIGDWLGHNHECRHLGDTRRIRDAGDFAHADGYPHSRATDSSTSIANTEPL